MNGFRPITKLEKQDLDKSRNLYRGFTFFGALTCGFMSYRFRRLKISTLQPHEAPRESNFIVNVILNDALSALLGYTLGNLIACDYTYKRRMYVLERLYFEKQNSTI